MIPLMNINKKKIELLNINSKKKDCSIKHERRERKRNKQHNTQTIES